MRRITMTGLAAAGLLLTACSPLQTAAQPATGTTGTQAPAAQALAVQTPKPQQQPAGPPGVQASGILRLGLTGNMADAPALTGWQMGYFGQNLGKITLEPELLPSGEAEATALLYGQLDAAYLDPVTALQVWQASQGKAIKIIAGAASGGAELITAPAITSPAQLKNQHLAAPAASAQQAAADHWLRQHSLPALTRAEASASTPTAILREFRAGKIAGGWEPPPLDVQMTNAGGHALVKESALWPGGQFPTAVLVVTQQFLTANPAAVTGLLKGQIQADHFLTTSPVSAAAAIAQRLAAIGTPLPAPVITKSLKQLTFTENPLPGPLSTQAANAATAGMIKPPANLTSIYDLTPLNQIRKAAGQPPISTQ